MDQDEAKELTKEELDAKPDGFLFASEPFKHTWETRRYSYEGFARNEFWKEEDKVHTVLRKISVHRQRVKDTSKYNPKECNMRGNR